MLPTPRILNDPDGWRSSSFAKTWHLAAVESDSDATHGVLIHGGRSPALDLPLLGSDLRGLALEGMVIFTFQVYSGCGRRGMVSVGNSNMAELNNIALEQLPH
jgi:hypothetical protein